MDYSNYQPEGNSGRKILVRDVIVIVVLVAMGAFVLGDRWDSIWQNWRLGSSDQNQQLPEDLDYTEVEEVYDVLRTRFDGELNLNDLMNGLKRGLADAAGDDYTLYLTSDEASEFLSDLNGSFSGIGAELGLENDRIIIVAPLEGFPAEAAGLRPKDIILQINGEDATGLSIEEAVNKIRGPVDTDVTLTILRGEQQFDVTITRADITVPSVRSEVQDGLGILRISRFGEDTVAKAREAAEDFRRQNVRGVVLDLRNNGGGFLDGAVGISGLWLDDKVVVQTKRGGVVIDTERSGSDAVLEGLPTVVLINEGSASASEIVAGALQDYDVATLIGTQSFGKGSVQEFENISSGGALKVTVARWFTPNGNNIDQTGITPDIEVEITEEDIEAENDPQLDRAKSELR